MTNTEINPHRQFVALPIADTCTWPGTEWEGTGTNRTIKPCGEPAVGAGLFCEPQHEKCVYHSLCERHSRNGQEESWTTPKS